MKEYLYTIKLPLVLAIVNSVLWHTLYQFLPEISGSILFNSVRVLIFAWAGWLVVASSKGGLLGAALSGVVLLFFDHLVVSGGVFLIQGEYQAFYGVILSFVMFAFVSAAIGLVGGVSAKLGKRKPPNQSLKSGTPQSGAP